MPDVGTEIPVKWLKYELDSNSFILTNIFSRYEQVLQQVADKGVTVAHIDEVSCY